MPEADVVLISLEFAPESLDFGEFTVSVFMTLFDPDGKRVDYLNLGN